MKTRTGNMFNLVAALLLCLQISNADDIFMSCGFYIDKINPKKTYTDFLVFAVTHKKYLDVLAPARWPLNDFTGKPDKLLILRVGAVYESKNDILKLFYTKLLMQGQSYVEAGLIKQADFSLDQPDIPRIISYILAYPRNSQKEDFTFRTKEEEKAHFKIEFKLDISGAGQRLENLPASFVYEDQKYSGRFDGLCNFTTREREEKNKQ